MSLAENHQKLIKTSPVLVAQDVVDTISGNLLITKAISTLGSYTRLLKEMKSTDQESETLLWFENTRAKGYVDSVTGVQIRKFSQSVKKDCIKALRNQAVECNSPGRVRDRNCAI